MSNNNSKLPIAPETPILSSMPQRIYYICTQSGDVCYVASAERYGKTISMASVFHDMKDYILKRFPSYQITYHMQGGLKGYFRLESLTRGSGHTFYFFFGETLVNYNVQINVVGGDANVDS